MNIPHPIPYQGSKRRLAPLILGYFPKDIGVVIEPFAGSGAITLAAAARHKAGRFALNDVNKALMELWDRIILAPEELADSYEAVWRRQAGREREYYDEIRRRFNQTGRADYFLYLLARCVKASVRYNANGEFNQSPDNRRKGTRPETMRQQILSASALLRGRTTVTSGDYGDSLARASAEDIVYLDPPYQGVCGDRDQRYVKTLSYEAFADSLAELNDRGISYIVSYDGRTGDKTYGRKLPKGLRLKHIEVHAGRSTQATLLGRDHVTYESLYLSPALLGRLGEHGQAGSRRALQLSLLGAEA